MTETSGQTAFLQVNIGCRHNQCIFCNFYKDICFREKSGTEIMRDIDRLVEYYQQYSHSPISRLMLLDADGLDVKHKLLLRTLEYAQKRFPKHQERRGTISEYDETYEQFYDTITKVCYRPIEFSSFTYTETIIAKGIDQLKELNNLGLNLIWWGVESASPDLLRLVRKVRNGSTDSRSETKKLFQAAEILEQSSIFYIPIILVGLGGETFFDEHVTKTTKFLEEIQPPGYSLSELVIPVGSVYCRFIQQGRLDLLSSERMREQRAIFENLNIETPQFDYGV